MRRGELMGPSLTCADKPSRRQTPTPTTCGRAIAAAGNYRGPVIVDSAVYQRGERVAVDCPTHDYEVLRKAAPREGDFVWVGLHQPDARELGDVAEAFGLHPLAVEDAVKAHQRPKLEHYDDTCSSCSRRSGTSTRTTPSRPARSTSSSATTSWSRCGTAAAPSWHSARHDLEERATVLTHGPSAVVYAVCDSVVDAYVEVVDELEEDVDEVEASVFSTEPHRRLGPHLHAQARDRRGPPGGAAAARADAPVLRRGSCRAIDDETAPFFRDVADHLTRAAEVVDTLDGLLSTAFDAHLAADLGAAERRHAQDLRRRRPGRRPRP